MRQLRLAREWTLADLSKHSGVALSSLSRIETDKMTGTLESHLKIARALGVRLAELYADMDGAGPTLEVRRESEIADALAPAKGASVTLLTSHPLQKKMLAATVRLQPGKSSQKEQHGPGVEKFVCLLRGKLQITVGKDEARLNPGDTAYFQASVSHVLKNVGTGPAWAVQVVCPPTL